MEDQMTSTGKPRLGSITGCVIDCGRPVVAAKSDGKSKKYNATDSVKGQCIIEANVQLFCVDPAKTADAKPERTTCSNEQGEFEFKDLEPGNYWVRCCAFAWENTIPAEVKPGCCSHICFEVPLALTLDILAVTEDCQPPVLCPNAYQGRTMLARAGCAIDLAPGSTYDVTPSQGEAVPSGVPSEIFITTAFAQGAVTVTVVMSSGTGTNLAHVATFATFTVIPMSVASGATAPNSLRAASGLGFAADTGGGLDSSAGLTGGRFGV